MESLLDRIIGRADKPGDDDGQIRYVGVVLSGRIGVELPDGSSLEAGPGTVYDIPPSHDGWTIPAEVVEFQSRTRVRQVEVRTSETL